MTDRKLHGSQDVVRSLTVIVPAIFLTGYYNEAPTLALLSVFSAWVVAMIVNRFFPIRFIFVHTLVITLVYAAFFTVWRSLADAMTSTSPTFLKAVMMGFIEWKRDYGILLVVWLLYTLLDYIAVKAIFWHCNRTHISS
ncbi:MAG TPA: hypothetical protein VJB02_03560 [Coxiellaceae bacterium]|nr:hypothetical protein [Coxiellaceae bacterium]